MTVVSLLIAVLVIVVVGLTAYWIITKFLPDPMKMIALAIVGIVLLLILLALVMPDVGNFQLWRK